jgi:hypothetical protein
MYCTRNPGVCSVENPAPLTPQRSTSFILQHCWQKWKEGLHWQSAERLPCNYGYQSAFSQTSCVSYSEPNDGAAEASGFVADSWNPSEFALLRMQSANCCMFAVRIRDRRGRLYGLVLKSSWLQIQWSGSDSRRYQIFRERGPLRMVTTTEELLGRNVAPPV